MSHFGKILVIFVSLLMVGSAITIITVSGFSTGPQKQYSNVSPLVSKIISENSSSLPSSQVAQMSQYSPDASFRFIETGLPTGTQWSVALDNTTFKTRNSSLYLNIQSGLYNYSISNSLNFFSPQSTGTVNTSSAIQMVHYYGYLHTEGFVNISSGIVSQNPGANFNNYVIPYGIFDNYSHSIIVASNGNNSIISLNASDYRVNGFLNINGNPGGLALNPNGTIYVTTSSQLVEVSQNLFVKAIINISDSGVTSVAYNEYSGLIFVGTYSNGTYIFNSTTLKQVGHLNGLDVLSTQGFAIDSADHMTIAADYLNNSIWFIKGSTPVSYGSSIGMPISILLDPNCQNLLISTFPTNGYSLFSVNITTGFVNAIGGVSWGMAITFDSETGTPFVSDIASNGILPINYQQSSGLEILRTSYEPYFVIFDPITNTVVSGGIYSNSLSLMNFSMIPANLTFSEQGLSKGEHWGIEINGYNVSTSNDSLSLQVLPGKVNFTVINPSGYTTNATGHTIANSTNSNVIIYFHRLYTVNFLETGIPSGTSWSIKINGELHSSTTELIETNLTAGNYIYLINSISVYKPTLPQGTIEISGDVNFTVVFSKELYTVEFLSHGLPSGYTWSTKVDSRLFFTNDSYLFLNVTGGQLNFTINPVPGYIPYPADSTITVSINDTIVNISWSPVLFGVKIMESGLPVGETWGVSVGNVSAVTSSSMIEFYEPNGTYTMHPFTKSGNYSSDTIQFTMKGRGVELNVSFSPVLYSVDFVRQNYGGVWYVNLSNGIFSGPISGSSYSFSLLNGTYHFRTSAADKMYRPSPSSGSFSVNGTTVSESINFQEVKYLVTFNESGLPADTTWYVNLTNGIYSGAITGTSYSISLANGTYSCTIATANKIYSPLQSSGSFTVNGVALSVPVTFSEVTYKVTFTETGLPSGIAWYVNLTNGMDSGPITGSFYSLSLANGSYTYVIKLSNSEFRPISSSGSFLVSGSKENIATGFMEVTFGLSLKISNLPSGTSWSIFVNGSLYRDNMTANNYSILLPNGTYSIEILSSSKNYYPAYFNVEINGHNVSSIITLHPVLYEVMIKASGLPAHTFWQIIFPNGTVLSSHYSSMEVQLMNGTYNITYLTSNHIYRGSELTVMVSGSNETVNATFTKVTFGVSFNIAGQYIPSAWYLVISGNDTVGPNNGNITIYLPNGTYTFKANPLNTSWYDFKGILHVNGSDIVVSVSFKPVLYDVNFTMVSPSNPKVWMLQIAGQSYTVNKKSFKVDLQNGSYIYMISGIRGYETYTSYVVVSGRDQTVRLIIPELEYDVSFMSNLKSGTPWNVSVSNGYHYSSSNNSLMTSLPDGKYNYTATSPGYDNANGYFRVNGKSVVVKVHFISTLHRVRFLENGLPHGTQWWVNITGMANLSSSNHMLVILLHNGLYSYRVSHVNGYMSQHSGNFTVNNRSVTLHLHFAHISETRYSVTFIEFLLPGVNVNISVNDRAVSGGGIELSNGTYNLSVEFIGIPFSIPIESLLTVMGTPVQVFLIDTPIALWVVEIPSAIPLPPMPLQHPMNPLPALMPGGLACSPNLPQNSPLINSPWMTPHSLVP